MSQSASADFRAYAAALRNREAGGNYAAVNQFGFTGAYQFGKPALVDVGFLDRQGRWTPYAISQGVEPWEAFKNNPTAQDTAFQNLTERNWDTLKGHMKYVGQTIGGVPITVSGMLAGAHLVGAGNVKRFLDSGGAEVPRDGKRRSIVRRAGLAERRGVDRGACRATHRACRTATSGRAREWNARWAIVHHSLPFAGP